jgi:hypothetical protein
MDQEFYRIYEQLYDLRASDPLRSRVFWLRRLLLPPFDRSGSAPVGWVRESIDAASANLPGQLRPDAKYFLLTNFVEMVLLPLYHSENPVRLEENELRDAVFQDVQMLVRRAAEERQAEEITAADILRVTAGSLDDLRVNKFRGWGGKDDGEQ